MEITGLEEHVPPAVEWYMKEKKTRTLQQAVQRDNKRRRELNHKKINQPSANYLSTQYEYYFRLRFF